MFFQTTDPLEEVSELALFLWVFVLALFLYIFFPSYAYHAGILVIAILQFIWLLEIKIFQRLADSGAASFGQRQMFFRWGSGALIGLMAVSVFFLLLYPLVKWVFFTGFGLFARTIGTILGYPIYWLISRLYSNADLDKPSHLFD